MNHPHPEQHMESLPHGSLKMCPLCDTINSKEVEECFVCGWHGRFKTDRLSVLRGLRSLLSRCPEIRL